jgi:hypothetical protein
MLYKSAGKVIPLNPPTGQVVWPTLARISIITSGQTLKATYCDADPLSSDRCIPLSLGRYSEYPKQLGRLACILLLPELSSNCHYIV